MSLSKAPMNSGTLVSLSAAAMAVKTSMISECVSAKRHATTTMESRALRTIARINLNVLFREVARPEAGSRRTSAMQYKTYQALFIIQFFLELGFREIRGHTALANQHALQMNVNFGRIEGD